ncbi:ankyrin repeat-containing protein ITN1-like [Humulus lupulus]|uniref:ankyrin repeat-containing protein ITN1-like n=1 Tax=Humulus lupulus TaxID=3486 RepID=UPI002B4101F9|nr:ankyrin repeat-containing protein ITN1-like [Humulus lupulus]
MPGPVELLKSSLTQLEEHFIFIQRITNRYFDWFHGEHLQDVNSLDPLETTCGQENNVFHVAVKCGASPQADPVKTWLRDHSLLAFQPNNRGDTPLHVAAKLGNKIFAEVLINHVRELVAAQGHNNYDYTNLLTKVNYVEENTALHEAALSGHFEIAQLLIEADPTLTSFENKSGESPLFLAVEGRFYDIASIILDTFPHCSVLGRSGMTVMHAAVIRSCRTKETLLLSRNITRGFDEFVKQLLERCGSQILEEEDELGWMPHHYAAQIGQSGVFQLLLKARRCVAYIKDKQGMTALHISARNGHIGVIRTLMKECPDIGELLDNRDRTALHIAVEHEQGFVVNTLLSMRAFVGLINEKDNEGNTALHVAAKDGYSDIFKRLANNRNTNKRIINKMGMTAFDIVRKSTINNFIGEAILLSSINKKGLVLSLQNTATVKKPIETSEPKEENDNQDAKHILDMSLVASTLFAGITFQVAITMPGAGNYNSSKGLQAFKDFSIWNSASFGLSLGNILFNFVIVHSNRFNRRKYRKYINMVTSLITIFSVTTFMFAFMMATEALTYEKKELNSMSTIFNNNYWGMICSPGNVAMAAFSYMYVITTLAS